MDGVKCNFETQLLKIEVSFRMEKLSLRIFTSRVGRKLARHGGGNSRRERMSITGLERGTDEPVQLLGAAFWAASGDLRGLLARKRDALSD